MALACLAPRAFCGDSCTSSFTFRSGRGGDSGMFSFPFPFASVGLVSLLGLNGGVFSLIMVVVVVMVDVVVRLRCNDRWLM